MEEPCPLCGSASRLLGKNSARSMLHCAECDMVHVPRTEHLTPAQQRARYLQHENTMENDEYVRRFEEFIARLNMFIPPSRRVLDYGCGPGPVLMELLRKRGDDASGFDPHFAPEIDPGRPFDLIVSTETFEHFAEPRAELRRIYDLLRSEGILGVMTQLHAGPERVLDWWYARDPTHVCFYSRRTMEWIAAEFEMKLLDCDGKSLSFFEKD